MLAKAFIFICGVAAGALVYDTMLERAAVRPRGHITQTHVAQEPRVLSYTIKQDGDLRLDRGKPMFPLQRPVKEYKR